MTDVKWSRGGEHDNRQVFENTLPAFAHARDAGVWGIECDIRWTADLVPIVAHDTDAARVFGEDLSFSDVSFAELRERLPLVPSLAELVAEFGGNIHLMMEIKQESYPDPARQQQALADLLAELRPAVDYHFLALDPALFRYVGFAPARSLLPVAEFNVGTLSQLGIAEDYAGLAGHYLLLGSRVQQRHRAQGQHIGTGHVGSRNALFREQQLLDRLLTAGK